MNSEKKDIIYSAEDIQQYLTGKLSPAEMHAMEKAALEDDFLAEAMEGYAAVPEEEWKKQLVLLKNDFPEKQTGKMVAMPLRPNRFFGWKVAAAAMLICSSLALAYLFTTKSTAPDNPLASANKPGDSIRSTHTESNAAATETSAIAPIKIPPNKKAGKVQPSNKENQHELADNTFIYRPELKANKPHDSIAGGGYVENASVSADDIASNRNITSNTQNTLESPKEKSLQPAAAPATAAEKNEIQTVPNRKFLAQVLAPDGSPLPFANVSITGQQIGTYADVRGNFGLVSYDSVLNVEIKAAGFVVQSYTLRSGEKENRITLAEDINALKNKTTVLGRGTPLALKRRAVLVPDSVITVEPADGWVNYDSYINNNLSVPEDVAQKKIHGEVEISFEVQENGALTDIKIDKSLCQDCDEAAVRAIKDGPRWKAKKGNKARGKIKLRF